MAAVLPPVRVNFPSLRSLSLAFPESGAEVELDEPDLDAVHRLLETVAPALTRLSISGDAVWGRESLSAFRALQELELISNATFDGLRNIPVCHCGALTSLTLLPAFSCYPDEMFAALDAHPSTLPGLTTFKYLNYMGVEVVADHHVHALCKFLKNKNRLRRLDVLLDGPVRAKMPWLELLPALPALEVLGFDFLRHDWLPDDVLFFERVLPARLSALRLQPVADILHAPYREAWLKLCKSRMSLRHLHIFETIMVMEPPTPREDSDLGLCFHPLPAEELPSSLELFGYGLYLRPVVRGPLDDPDSSIDDREATRAAFGPCWPLEKVTFRTAQDFGSSDWEWLLRWHDFCGLGSLRPGVLKGGV